MVRGVCDQGFGSGCLLVVRLIVGVPGLVGCVNRRDKNTEDLVEEEREQDEKMIVMQ